VTRVASRSSFPCIRSRKPAGARPRHSTVILLISAWSRSWRRAHDRL
jgi:hypothetical protein